MGKIKDYIVKTNSTEWKPLVEKNVNTNDIYVIPLRYNETGRAPSIMLKFEPGASYPYHNHPSGEELFVLDGSCFINETKLEKGDYLYTPPNAKHSVRSETGCIILFIVPGEVEII
jgi:quercetin dioxygenase-like cupin family protein